MTDPALNSRHQRVVLDSRRAPRAFTRPWGALTI